MIRRALAVAAFALLVAAAPILAAVLRLDGGSLTVFTVTPSLPIVAASVEIRPGTLARQGQGPPVTVLIEAPDRSFDVRRVVAASIRLCLDGPLCDTGASGGAPRVGDADHDGIRDLEVALSRADVLALVTDLPAPADITFVVSAVLQGGRALSGTDTVMLVGRGPGASDEDEPDGDEAAGTEPDDPTEPPGSPEDASPSPSAPPGEPSAEPEPPIVPAPTPAESAPPSSEPSPPGAQPTPTPDPGGEPTIEPSPTPATTAEPTPVASPSPVETPAPAPTAEPTPVPTPDPADEPRASPSPGDEAH